MGSHPERVLALSLTGLGGSSNFFGSGAGLRSRSLLASFLQATYNTLSLTRTSTLIQKNAPEQGRSSQRNKISECQYYNQCCKIQVVKILVFVVGLRLRPLLWSHTLFLLFLRPNASCPEINTCTHCKPQHSK